MKMLFFEVDTKQELYFKKAFPHDELFFYQEPIPLKTIPNDQFDAQVISTAIRSSLTKEIFDLFPYLKAVISRTTGSDHIDCVAAQEKNICVYTLPTYATQAVAEYTFALLLALVRKVALASESIERENYGFLRGSELADKTLGIIGFGMIGKAVARIALGFSMKVIVYDPQCNLSELSVSFVSCTALLERSDVISVNVPLTNSTKYMLNSEAMRSIKKGSYLVNTSRGGVIETRALIDALENNILGGVALDVLEEEFFTYHPLALLRYVQATKEVYKKVLENNYLMKHPRAIISPHYAFNSQEALERSMQETKECIEAWKKTV